MRRQNKKKSSKWSLALKIFLILAASLLLCLTALGVYLSKKAETAANNAFEQLDDRASSDLRTEKVKPIEDNISVLFVGVDDSEQRNNGAENSRSDALILATLNSETKTIKLLSIPRDSYVNIPYVGYSDKINHAHAYGGTLATIETVEELFNVPIDYYVRMNFNAFIEVIDALGGIEVDVPYSILEKDEFDRNTVQLVEGRHVLAGREALALARTRKADSDIERGKRQQEIIKAIALKAANPTSILKYDNVLEALGDNMKTDMTYSEIKQLFSYVTSGLPRIDTLNLAGYDDQSTGVYYYQLDPNSVEEITDILQNHLGLDQSSLSESSSFSESAASN